MRDKIDFILQFGRISNMQILEVVNLIIITAIGSPPPRVALRSNAGHGLHILEVSRSHTTNHTW